MPFRKSMVLERICQALFRGATEEASRLARQEYPFISVTPKKHRYTEHQSTRVFIRDGSIDRYAGTRLVFPGALRLLSQLLLEEFPAHRNWKMAESRIVYWELYPTVDHIVPLARGGSDDESNWITTSMLRNSAKSNWTLEELGWTLSPPGQLHDWDGLTGWFLKFAGKDPEILRDGYIDRWYRAATRMEDLFR